MDPHLPGNGPVRFDGLSGGSVQALGGRRLMQEPLAAVLAPDERPRVAAVDDAISRAGGSVHTDAR